MSFPRYYFSDAYTLEELRREYKASDARGRIRLLRKLYRGGRAVPFEIALLAVEDPNVEVRQWIAHHGEYLDYRECRYDENQVHYEHPERNLEDRLKNDPDPFVRACLHENPTVFSGFAPWEGFFREGSHLERLALVRNPGVDIFGHGLIKKIFDPEDKELGITMKERQELVLAFLTNKEALVHAESAAALGGHEPWEEAPTWWLFLDALWELASKWPEETAIQPLVYRHVPASDETKARTYRTCKEPFWRHYILENCDARDTQTIQLGMKDADETCRDIAEEARSRERYNWVDVPEGRTIGEVKKKPAPKDPEELFGEEGRLGNFIEDKLDFIGKSLLSLDQGRSKSFQRLEVYLIIIALTAGIALLVQLFR
ncbi:MAG: hypothetical protein L0191_20750 [Acidobacteria bacterium]|nr:hypothetical protein [Acidobacteriota bacterium]